MSDRFSEIEHRYGPRVHILGDPFLLSVLARIGSPGVRAPEVYPFVRTAYRLLLGRAIGNEFPVVERAVETRMRAKTERGIWRGVTVDPSTEVVIANVMRAGNLPSLICFEEVAPVLEPDGARIDHFYFSRKTDANGRVIGVSSAGSKVGGPIAGRVLLIPDPMGATGSTTLETLRAYRELDAGAPSKVIALHLMITPEYVRRVLHETDDVIIYAGRLDRGMSPPDVLDTIPGSDPARERGLDDHCYIVPGAGGLGEVLNNAWV